MHEGLERYYFIYVLII